MIGDEISAAFSAIRVMMPTSQEPIARTWETVLKIPGDRLANCQSAEDAVDMIKGELVSLKVEHDLDRVWLLSIPPIAPDGFSIDLIQTSSQTPLRCLFGMLEHDCETFDEAFLWITRALSLDYQLRTIYVGGDPRQFFLEPIHPNGGVAIECGIGLPFLWRREITTKIRKNTLPLSHKMSS